MDKEHDTERNKKNNAFIYHSFERYEDTAGRGNWSVICWIRISLLGFGIDTTEELKLKRSYKRGIWQLF